ncbi:MAG: Uma2 family endonuclease [Caldilineales bacterium]|nr:Uma2 family endonuclease [Caldilineales bacterium]
MSLDVLSPTLFAEERPDIAHLITEDDTPVDNLPSEKQQRLLVEPLYSSWQPGRPFLAAANVGIFWDVHEQAIVPDMFLSLDVEVAPDWWAPEHRSYFLWEFRKPPDVVVEIVSNRRGQEASTKLETYARMGIPYYVIYDPQGFVQRTPVVVHELRGGLYHPRPDMRLEGLGLGLTLWEGVFEGRSDRWLRWCTLEGALIPTGAERAEEERRRVREALRLAAEERRRAEEEARRAEEEHRRAERLAARLRSLGIDPDA